MAFRPKRQWLGGVMVVILTSLVFLGPAAAAKDSSLDDTATRLNGNVAAPKGHTCSHGSALDADRSLSSRQSSWPVSSLSDRMESLLRRHHRPSLSHAVPAHTTVTSLGFDSDFLQRLQEEDRRSSAIDRPSTWRKTSQLLFWGASGGMLLVLATSSLTAPSSSAWFWREVCSTGIGWYWLAWVRPHTTLAEMLTPLASLLDPTVRSHVWDSWLPQLGRTMRRIAVAELWNAYFRRMWKELEGLLAESVSGTGSCSVVADGTERAEPKGATTMRWLYDGHRVAVEILERGFKKVVQSSMQKQLQSSMSRALAFLMDVLHQVSSRGVLPLSGHGEFLSL